MVSAYITSCVIQAFRTSTVIPSTIINAVQIAVEEIRTRKGVRTHSVQVQVFLAKVLVESVDMEPLDRED